MRPKASDKAALSNNPLFDRGQKWELSTSALCAGEGRGGLFRGTGCVACLLLEAPQKRKLGLLDLNLARHISKGVVLTVSCAPLSYTR